MTNQVDKSGGFSKASVKAAPKQRSPLATWLLVGGTVLGTTILSVVFLVRTHDYTQGGREEKDAVVETFRSILPASEKTVALRFLETWKTKGAKATRDMWDSRIPADIVASFTVDEPLKSYETPVPYGRMTMTMRKTGEQYEAEQFHVKVVTQGGFVNGEKFIPVQDFLPATIEIVVSKDQKRIVMFRSVE